jgi:hypothetical protein
LQATLTRISLVQRGGEVVRAPSASLVVYTSDD